MASPSSSPPLASDPCASPPLASDPCASQPVAPSLGLATNVLEGNKDQVLITEDAAAPRIFFENTAPHTQLQLESASFKVYVDCTGSMKTGAKDGREPRKEAVNAVVNMMPDMADGFPLQVIPWNNRLHPPVDRKDYLSKVASHSDTKPQCIFETNLGELKVLVIVTDGEILPEEVMAMANKLHNLNPCALVLFIGVNISDINTSVLGGLLSRSGVVVMQVKENDPTYSLQVLFGRESFLRQICSALYVKLATGEVKYLTEDSPINFGSMYFDIREFFKLTLTLPESVVFDNLPPNLRETSKNVFPKLCPTLDPRIFFRTDITLLDPSNISKHEQLMLCNHLQSILQCMKCLGPQKIKDFCNWVAELSKEVKSQLLGDPVIVAEAKFALSQKQFQLLFENPLEDAIKAAAGKDENLVRYLDSRHRFKSTLLHNLDDFQKMLSYLLDIIRQLLESVNNESHTYAEAIEKMNERIEKLTQDFSKEALDEKEESSVKTLEAQLVTIQKKLAIQRKLNALQENKSKLLVSQAKLPECINTVRGHAIFLKLLCTHPELIIENPKCLQRLCEMDIFFETFSVNQDLLKIIHLFTSVANCLQTIPAADPGAIALKQIFFSNLPSDCLRLEATTADSIMEVLGDTCKPVTDWLNMSTLVGVCNATLGAMQLMPRAVTEWPNTSSIDAPKTFKVDTHSVEFLNRVSSSSGPPALGKLLPTGSAGLRAEFENGCTPMAADLGPPPRLSATWSTPGAPCPAPPRPHLGLSYSDHVLPPLGAPYPAYDELPPLGRVDEEMEYYDDGPTLDQLFESCSIGDLFEFFSKEFEILEQLSSIQASEFAPQPGTVCVTSSASDPGRSNPGASNPEPGSSKRADEP
jgi:hypothetical protein